MDLRMVDGMNVEEVDTLRSLGVNHITRRIASERCLYCSKQSVTIL